MKKSLIVLFVGCAMFYKPMGNSYRLKAIFPGMACSEVTMKGDDALLLELTDAQITTLQNTDWGNVLLDKDNKPYIYVPPVAQAPVAL